MKVRSFLPAWAALALCLLLVLGAAPRGIQIELPISGWTPARTTQLVAQLPMPLGDGVPELSWLGRRWELLASPEGRVSAWLPVLPGMNELGVELSRGAKGELLRASVRLSRIEAAGADDLIVIAGWKPGRARLDLRVTDPSGEACDAAIRRTRLGGVRLRDDPEGPGPHVFVLPHAVSGEYQVSMLCGRLPPGQGVAVQALALLFAGTAREERFDLSGVVGRCDEVTDLGTVEVAGRLPGPH